ncbi:MAG: hypothetical protein V2J55_20555 [Candidatus Competibacteraceae bacterium]|jgi:hypothetical protein|nr:hypothetical protein [Candidatus Competibacteraceae bacterium]
MTPPPFPESIRDELNSRPACGNDILLLQQWRNLTEQDLRFLLGISIQKMLAYTRNSAEPVSDPGLGMLLWALINFPETHFMTIFPEPGEVYQLYSTMAEQSTKTLAAKRSNALGRVAFGLLLGRDMNSATRWLSETNPRPPTATVRRLLYVFLNFLQRYGVQGLDAWFERTQLEARERQLNLSNITSWTTRAKPRRSQISGRHSRSAQALRALHISDTKKRPGVTPPVLSETSLPDLKNRGVRGRDLVLLRQWYGLNLTETCYLFGISTQKWPDYQNNPDELVDDVGLSLLVWALTRFPEAQYLPVFPTPTDVYPLYEQVAKHSTPRLTAPAMTFGLLLGRSRALRHRWFKQVGNPARVAPTELRLLYALRAVLQTHGVVGFNAWIHHARVEAESRGFDFDSMRTWTDPKKQPEPIKTRRGRPPRQTPAVD